MLRKVLVVGGNGFIGSAICRAALSKGQEVVSVSSSGRPYQTPKGHVPTWTTKVTWLKGNALEPSTFYNVLSDVDGVVHTLGTLFEDGAYKRAIREGNPLIALVRLLEARLASENPLRKVEDESYDSVNRDSAIRVCKAFMDSDKGPTHSQERPFVYISAEDVFRPFVPERYIQSKYEAEKAIEALISSRPEEYRGIYIRPGLVYHAHFRPLTTPPAVLLDFSAALHSKLPDWIPTPAKVMQQLGGIWKRDGAELGSALESMASALVTHPIHVDQVAEAVCAALTSPERIRGVVDVNRMRELVYR